MAKERKEKKFIRGEKFNKFPVTKERILKVMEPIMKYFAWNGNSLVYSGEVEFTSLRIDFDANMITVGRMTSMGWKYKEVPFDRISVFRICHEERSLSITQQTNKINNHWQTFVHMNKLVYNERLGESYKTILNQALKGVGWKPVQMNDLWGFEDSIPFHVKKYKVLFNVHYAEVVKPDGGIFNLYYEDIDHVEIVADSHIRLAYHWRGAPAETLL